MKIADCDSDKNTNYWITVSTDAPDEVQYTEIDDDVEKSGTPQHQVFANISTDYQYKDLLSYSSALSGYDLGDLLVWLNSPDIELLVDSEGQTLRDSTGNDLNVYK